MSKNIKSLLKQLGFSDREQLVFIALSQMGEARAQDIAHKTYLPRTTVASILDRLKEKGFVIINKVKGKFVYWIEDPFLLVEQERVRLAVAEQLAGQLQDIYHSAEKKPTADIYDTPDRIAQLFTRVIKETEKRGEVLAFESPSKKHYDAVLSDALFDVMAKEKVKKGIRTRILIPSGQESGMSKKKLSYNVEARILPEGVLMETSFWVLQKSVVLFYGAHTFAVEVRHKQTRESMRSLFEYFWKQSTLVK
jgi:sugar-specific transcriptional regulator TrmB